MNRVYFTSDLHFGHASVLKHSLKRPFVDKEEMVEHDDWLLDLWWRTVDSGDTVYLLVDLTAYKGEAARQLLEKLPGRKILIEGNHDVALYPYYSFFFYYRVFPEGGVLITEDVSQLVAKELGAADGLARATREMGVIPDLLHKGAVKLGHKMGRYISTGVIYQNIITLLLFCIIQFRLF